LTEQSTASAGDAQLLRAAVEHGLDGVVIVSTSGQMISMNHRFVDMWSIPDEVVESGDDGAALRWAMTRTVDPDAFMGRVEALYADPSTPARDELVLRDGRVFDRYGTPLRNADGTYLGWAWYFRDVTDVREAERQRAQDAEKMAGLLQVARALGGAQNDEEVLYLVNLHGVSALGAEGTVLVLAGPHDNEVRALSTSFFDDRVRADISVLPADYPLPMVHTTATGVAYFLPDRAAALELFPGGADIYERAGTHASACVPLSGGDGTFGALAVAFAEPRRWREAEQNLLVGLAALTAQALERLAAQRAERETAAVIGRWSETLQRSLLSAPHQPAGVEIAVRYQPAAHEAQVGGDWYDAFPGPDGATVLVIGDVSGHDRDAAAAMAQGRNILRGVAQSLIQSPGAVLSMLDRAMARLQVSTLATAVLCQIHARSVRANAWTFRWSNAGHPPPLLLRSDGTACLLDRDPGLLLGLEPETLRRSHELELAAGDTVLLYTDGLVERRGEHLDDGLERLLTTAQQHAGLPLEQFCDALLTALGVGAEDDIALLAARPRIPRPGEGA